MSDAYASFAKEYGWTVIGAIQVSDFKEPTPLEVVKIIDQVKAEKVPAIFGTEVFPSRFTNLGHGQRPWRG